MTARPRLTGRLLLAAVGTALVLAAGRGLARTPAEQTSRSPAGGASVAVTAVRGPITPVVAEHIDEAVTEAAAGGREALVIELDTPGGLVTSMQQIVQRLLNAPLPVVVHVSPSGAEAASAGTFVTMAAHVAAMAPATTIGAATPVNLGGGSQEVGDKVVNNAAAYLEAIARQRGRDIEFAGEAVRDGRAVAASEAVDIGAVDLLAANTPELLERIDGRRVTVEGRRVRLHTAGAQTVRTEMSLARRIQQALADPNLAFLFLSLATLGIVYEVASPGMGAGGILGAVMLILAMFSLSVLPINLAGVALVVLAGVLFLIELFVPGIGVAAAGGSVALVLGGLLLVEESSGLGLDWWVVVPSGLVLFGMVVLAGRLVAHVRTTPSRAASDVLIGRRGAVSDVDGPRGRIRLDGTWWRARHARGRSLAEDQEVTVVDRDNLELLVEPAGPRASGDEGRDVTPGTTGEGGGASDRPGTPQ